MRKIKPILPSMKEKKRYLAFEILSRHDKYDFQAVSRNIWHSCLKFLGERGCAEAGIYIMPEKYAPRSQTGVIRMNSSSADAVKAALLFMDENHDTIVRSLGVSGILKKTEKFLAG
jgi:RNase P/RNase MRP subunit POP5